MATVRETTSVEPACSVSGSFVVDDDMVEGCGCKTNIVVGGWGVTATHERSGEKDAAMRPTTDDGDVVVQY